MFSILPSRRLLLSQQRSYQICCYHYLIPSYQKHQRLSSIQSERTSVITEAAATALTTAISKRSISIQRKKTNDKSNPTITIANLQDPWLWEKILPPADYFVSAQKSGTLPFGRDTAVKIASRIWQHLQQQNKDNSENARDTLGKDICKELAISPVDLTALAYILNQSIAGTSHDPSPPVRRLAAAILATASSMGEPVAIMRSNALVLLGPQSQSNLPAKQRLNVHNAKPTGSTEEEKSLQKILDLAENSKVVEAMVLAAEVYTRRHQRELAMKYWRMGAEYGSSHAVYMLAKLQARSGDKEGMKETLLKGIKSGNADCHFELAMESARDDVNGKDFFKNSMIAASSGIAVAAHNLGEYYRLHKEPKDIFIAEQWYRIGAESGIDWSMLQLSKILSDRKEYQEAAWWSNIASQGSPEVQAIATKFQAHIPAT